MSKAEELEKISKNFKKNETFLAFYSDEETARVFKKGTEENLCVCLVAFMSNNESIYNILKDSLEVFEIINNLDKNK